MNTIFNRISAALKVLPFFVAVSFSGCGGGSGSGNTTPPPSAVTIVGTAATGSPVANASVVFIGANGQQATTTTSSNGQYSITTTGLTSPYLVKATTTADIPGYPAGTVFYSVSADSPPSVVNVTPLTDLIVRTWYRTQPSPVTADEAFANPVANPPPAPGVVAQIESLVREVVGNTLADNGVDWIAMNLISTAFASNGAGVDAALGAINVNAASGTVEAGTLNTTITATSSQISTVAVSGVASSSSSMPAPTNAQDPVITGIQAALDTFSAAILAKGTQLADTDILPYLDANAMSGGFSRTQTAMEYADLLRARQAGDSFAFRVVRLDSQVGNIARVSTLFSKNTASGRFTVRTPAAFVQQASGQWLLAGDLHIAQVGAMGVTMAGNNTPTFTGISFYTNILQPAYGGTPFTTGLVPTVSGPGLSATTIPSNGTRENTFYASPSAAATTVVYDKYDRNFAATGVAGSIYTVSLPTAAGAVTYSFAVNSETTETISITGLNTGLGAGGADLGNPITVSWTLPKTFAVTGVQFEGATRFGTEVCMPANTPQFLPATATSGTITLPATPSSTCGSSTGTPTGAYVSVAVYGANGEQTRYTFNF